MSVVSLGRVGAAASVISVLSTCAVVNAQEAFFETEEPAVTSGAAPLAETSSGGLRALLLYWNHRTADWVQGFESALVATGQFGAAESADTGARHLSR